MNVHFAALVEIYEIYALFHRSKLNIIANVQMLTIRQYLSKESNLMKYAQLLAERCRMFEHVCKRLPNLPNMTFTFRRVNIC